MSYRLTAADHARLGLLRDRCRGLIDRAHGSIDRSAALLSRLPGHPTVPDGPRPAVGRGALHLPPPAGDTDMAALWDVAAAASYTAQAIVDRAAREVAQSAIDVARARELRQESLALRLRHLALGFFPPPAQTDGPEGGSTLIRESDSTSR